MEMDEQIRMNRAPQKVTTKRSDNFREITQDRVFAGIREGYFFYIIQSEEFDTNEPDNVEEGHFIDEVQVKLSPQQIVKMHKLFGQIIKNYETIYGEIKTLEQIVIENPSLLKGPSSES